MRVECICVSCGRKPATKGSWKHPYCKKCFEKIFHNDPDEYNRFMLKEHSWQNKW